MALGAPLVAGAWSDRLRTRLGERLPFPLLGAPVIAIAVAAMGGLNSLGLVALAVMVFFVAYYAAYEPYRRCIGTS